MLIRNSDFIHDIPLVKNSLFGGTGMIIQWPRALAAIPEHQCSDSAPTLGSSRPPVTPVPGNLAPSCGLLSHHTHGTHLNRHISKKVKLNNFLCHTTFLLMKVFKAETLCPW